MQKQKELFYFFGINPNEVNTFKDILASKIAPNITSTKQLLGKTEQQPLTAMNLAFSQKGIDTLLGTGSPDAQLGDQFFAQGQSADEENLGRPRHQSGVQTTSVVFDVSGLFLLASDTWDLVEDQLKWLKATLGTSASEMYTLRGAMRPGTEAGRESAYK